MLVCSHQFNVCTLDLAACTDCASLQIQMHGGGESYLWISLYLSCLALVLASSSGIEGAGSNSNLQNVVLVFNPYKTHYELTVEGVCLLASSPSNSPGVKVFFYKYTFSELYVYEAYFSVFHFLFFAVFSIFYIICSANVNVVFYVDFRLTFYVLQHSFEAFSF